MKFLNRPFLRFPGLLLSVSAFSALPLAAADPAAVVPDEAVAYLEADSQGLYNLEEHPVVKTLPLGKLEEILYKVMKTSVEEQEAIKKIFAEETGVSYEELTKKAGRVAISVHDLKVPSDPSPENVEAEISMAHEFDGDEAFMEKYIQAMVKVLSQQVEKQGQGSQKDVEELLTKVSETFEHSTEEHGGAKIHVFKMKVTEDTKEVPAALREWAACVHDKMILAASGQEQVEEMLDRMKSGSDSGSLAASAYYKADHDKTGKTLSQASVNLETVLGLVETHALPAAAGGKVDAKKLWTLLGADKLRSAVLSFSAGAETLDLSMLLTHSEKPGLFALGVIPGPGTAPGFIPKDAASASYQQLDVMKSFENLEKLLGEIEPSAAAGLQMGLTMAQTQLGVDVKKDILGQLGPDVWMAAAIVENDEINKSPAASEAIAASIMENNAVYAVRLKEPKAFELTLKTIINKAAPAGGIFEEREYQGYAIQNVKGVPEPMKLAYVLAGDWLMLCIGDQKMLEQILTRLEKSNDDGFFAQKDVARHLEALPGGQAVTSASNLGATVSAMVRAFKTIAEMSPSDEAKEIPFDELAKLLNVPLISVDKIWLEEKHTEYRMRIAPKE